MKMVFESKTSASMMSIIEGTDALRDNGDAGQLVRRRKKRRAADAMVKKFGGECYVICYCGFTLGRFIFRLNQS